MKLPSKKNVDNYLACNSCCPFCDSEHFPLDNPIETHAWRDMQCPDCDKQWRSVFLFDQKITTHGTATKPSTMANIILMKRKKHEIIHLNVRFNRTYYQDTRDER